MSACLIIGDANLIPVQSRGRQLSHGKILPPQIRHDLGEGVILWVQLYPLTSKTGRLICLYIRHFFRLHDFRKKKIL